MGLFPWWRLFLQREAERWGIDLRASGGGTIGPWLKPLWSTNTFPEASQCHSETVKGEKNSFAFQHSIFLHLQLIVESLRAMMYGGGRGEGGGQTLGSPRSLQIDELNRPGPWTPRNPPYMQWLFANRPFTQGQEPRQPGGWQVKFDLNAWSYAQLFQIWNPPQAPTTTYHQATRILSRFNSLLNAWD